MHPSNFGQADRNYLPRKANNKQGRKQFRSRVDNQKGYKRPPRNATVQLGLGPANTRKGILKHVNPAETNRWNSQFVQHGKVMDTSRPPFLSATPWIFDISWQTGNPINDVRSIIKQKAVNLAGPKYAVIGPYNPSFGSSEFKPLDLHPKNPLALTVASMRGLGFKVFIGQWNTPGNPTAILFDIISAQDHFNHGRQLFNNVGIDVSLDDGLANSAIIFGLLVGQFISIFRQLTTDQQVAGSNVHIPVVAHFHEWTTSLGIIFLKNIRMTDRVVASYTSHQTPSEEYSNSPVASFNINWLHHRMMIHERAMHTADGHVNQIPKLPPDICHLYSTLPVMTQ